MNFFKTVIAGISTVLLLAACSSESKPNDDKFAFNDEDIVVVRQDGYEINQTIQLSDDASESLMILTLMTYYLEDDIPKDLKLEDFKRIEYSPEVESSDLGKRPIYAYDFKEKDLRFYYFDMGGKQKIDLGVFLACKLSAFEELKFDTDEQEALFALDQVPRGIAPSYLAVVPAKYEGENIHVMLEFRKKNE